MRCVIACLFLFFASCKGFDLAPDEFRADYGTGNARSNFDNRNTDFETDSQWVAFGLTWYLGRSYIEDSLEREAKRTDEMYRMFLEKERAVAQPAQPAQPPPVNPLVHHEAEADEHVKPEPVDVSVTSLGGTAREYMIYAIGALLLVVAGILKRKFLIEGTVNVVHRARGKHKKKVAESEVEVSDD